MCIGFLLHVFLLTYFVTHCAFLIEACTSPCHTYRVRCRCELDGIKLSYIGITVLYAPFFCPCLELPLWLQLLTSVTVFRHSERRRCPTITVLNYKFSQVGIRIVAVAWPIIFTVTVQFAATTNWTVTISVQQFCSV